MNKYIIQKSTFIAVQSQVEDTYFFEICSIFKISLYTQKVFQILNKIC